MIGRLRALSGAVLLVCLVAASTRAQTPWDPQAYTGLIESGQSLHREALAEPPGSTARRDLLIGSLNAMRQAQEMLRRAILSDAVAPYRADAVAELFNLTDNITVELMTLDQCEAAAAEIDRLAADTALLPPDAGRHLEVLRGRLLHCRARVAAAPPAWNHEAYEAAQARADAFRERAASADDEQSLRSALFEARHAETLALGQLRTALLAGQPVPVERPVERLAVHYNRVIADLIEQGLCDAAESRLAERDETIGALSDDLRLTGYAGELSECRFGFAAPITPPAVVQTVEPPAPVEVLRRETNPWPWILIGAGASAAIAALAVDVSLIGDRGEFDDLRAECDGGGLCNHDALVILSDAIDRQKITIGVLVGVAVAGGAAGLVWILTSDDDEGAPRRALDLSPLAGPGVVGARLRFVH